MVQRYNGIEPDDEGAYVYYDDYASLEQRVKELEAYIKKADKLLAKADKIMARFSKENALLNARLEPIEKVYGNGTVIDEHEVMGAVEQCMELKEGK